jgi:membrane protein DedA with SNARE-associated domain
MSALPVIWVYVTILSIAYVENVAPPIPGDMVVVFGGYLAGLGQLNLVNVVVLSTIGGALGFMTMYAIGHRLGDRLMEPGRARWIPRAKVQKVRETIRKWGYGVVAANRFLSGLRSVISLTVGMAHMKPWRTAAYATLSAAVWTALIAYLGYLAGENWEAVKGYLSTYGKVITGVVAVLAVLLAVRIYRKRKARREAARAAQEGGKDGTGEAPAGPV